MYHHPSVTELYVIFSTLPQHPQRYSHVAFHQMAELLGIVTGGAGLASLALQLVDGGQKLRQRYKNTKGFGGNITWLSEDIELICKQLMQLEASADDIMQEQLGPIMMGSNLFKKTAHTDYIQVGQWKGELDELQALVAGLKQGISQYTIHTLVRSEHRKSLTTVVNTPSETSIVALSTDTAPYDNSLGNTIIEPVVDFDAPGFVILGKLALEEIGWKTAETMFRDLYKSCPGFVNQVGPSGHGYLDEGLPLHKLGVVLIPPLHASILFESDVNFKLCIERVAQPLEKIVNFLGQSTLHMGVCQPSRVAQLLAAGHPVDLGDKNGITPLMYAASMNVPETVMVLVENGADLFITYDKNFTVLHLVAFRGNWDLIWQIVDFASASYPDLVPELFASLLPYLGSLSNDICYAAHDPSGLKGCIKFWSRVISKLGSPNFYFNDDTDNDRFWDIPEQISIEELNQEMEGLAAKAYPELKIEVMIRLRRIWEKEYMEQWPGPQFVPRIRRNIQDNSARKLNGLLEEIRYSKQPQIPEPLSSSWGCIVQKKLRSNDWMLQLDLELAVVEFGVDLYRCEGDQFESWLPLLTQLTDVLLAEEPGAPES
ncbi:hypothetical protein FACUT_6484 [Fusarium acutatum]|uniref:Ankyrin n=1 Tax=Fusarium acutatum TaxID=78861 RepID=A0A8H4NIH0_9HYPO|nr:hypothetical protein FACUT_6484 [Fusarium acutatum]